MWGYSKLRLKLCRVFLRPQSEFGRFVHHGSVFSQDPWLLQREKLDPSYYPLYAWSLSPSIFYLQLDLIYEVLHCSVFSFSVQGPSTLFGDALGSSRWSRDCVTVTRAVGLPSSVILRGYTQLLKCLPLAWLSIQCQASRSSAFSFMKFPLHTVIVS
jgi:hypothetical protein